MKRTLIVGDVHGCLRELQALLRKCEYDSQRDDVVFCGDLVDRGRHSREVVEEAMKRRSARGNHDNKAVLYWEKRKRGEVVEYRNESHRRTAEELEDRHFEWLSQLPLYIQIPEHNVVVVHAGLVSGIPLEEQDPKFVMHAQMIRPEDTGPSPKSFWPTKAPKHAKFWAELYDGSLGHVVFGHTVFEEPFVSEHATGIDLGVPFGKRLAALILPSREIVSVPAQEVYHAGSRTMKVEIMPGVFTWS